MIFSSIEVGKDADIVIWERHPLRLGARPRHVFVDGAELDFKKSWTNTLIEEDMQKHFDVKNTSDDENEASKHLLPDFSDSTMRLEDHGLNNPTSFHDACSKDVNSFVLRNISRIYANASQVLDAEGSGLYLIVDRGVITCLGKDCDRDHIEWPSNSPVFEMGGAVVIPVKIILGCNV